MSMITLRQLQVFRAVARTEHVTAAAAQLGLSQSAVSSALAELAAQLGGPVFDRRGRRIALNDRGRRLQQDAAELLQRAEDLVSAYRTGAAGGGRLVVGASSTIGMHLLPELLARFAARRPAAEVELRVANTGAIAAALAAHELDLGFVEGPCEHPQVRAAPWRRDQLVVVAAPAHPLARRRRLAPADLAAARWVMREPGSGTREVFLAALRAHDIAPVVAATFGHGEAVKAGVRAGLGLGCLSRLAVRDELAAGRLVALRTPGLALDRQLWVVTRRFGYLGALPRAFLAAVAPSARDGLAQ